MGLFKKIFKGILAPFKWIGNKIKKGFQKLGKFMNSLGIVGQIGMMFITAGIGNAMMAGVRTLGAGFMKGLWGVGWQAGGQAATTAVAKKGMLAALARTSHAVMSGAGKLIQTGAKTVSDITGAVVNTVGQTVKSMGNFMTNGRIGAISKLDRFGKVMLDSAGKPIKGGFEDILPNFSRRLQGGWENFTVGIGDTAKTLGHSLPGGPQYSPEYKEFTLTEDEGGFFAKKKGDRVIREVNYSTKNMGDYNRFLKESAPFKKGPIEKISMFDDDPFKVPLQNTYEDYRATSTPNPDDVLSQFQVGLPTSGDFSSAPPVPSQNNLLARTGDAISQGFGKGFRSAIDPINITEKLVSTGVTSLLSPGTDTVSPHTRQIKAAPSNETYAVGEIPNYFQYTPTGQHEESLVNFIFDDRTQQQYA